MPNYRTVQQRRTVNYPVYGRVPIKDAKKNVSFKLEDEHIRDGRQSIPEACAIALAMRSNKTQFPGRFASGSTFKTHTLVATVLNDRMQVVRYVHSDHVQDAINGFDNPGRGNRVLQVGDIVTLLAPKGRKKLGVSNGRSNSGSVVPQNSRVVSECRKRAVFATRQDAILAAQELRGTPDKVVNA
jgi:hypothetical protein